jgi:hypothetical protein
VWTGEDYVYTEMGSGHLVDEYGLQQNCQADLARAIQRTSQVCLLLTRVGSAVRMLSHVWETDLA